MLITSQKIFHSLSAGKPNNMSVISQLSSQLGERDFNSNIKVANQCLKDPKLLSEVAEGLKSKEAPLAADCAEVFTKVAEQKPDLVAPYASNLIPLLDHKYTRARWEAMHAIALVAYLIPNEISKILPNLHRISLSDSSTIVRDYSVIAVSNYAKTSKKAAGESLMILKRILEVWKEKQAARALKGLQNVVEANPDLSREVLSLARPFENSTKGTVKKAAKDLLKAVNS